MKKLWKYLVGESLLRRTHKGYKRSPAFTTFLKTMNAPGSGYQGDLGADFASGGDFESSSDPFENDEEPVEDDEADHDEPPF